MSCYVRCCLWFTPAGDLAHYTWTIKHSAGFQDQAGSCYKVFIRLQRFVGKWQVRAMRFFFFSCADERCSTGTSGHWSPEFTQRTYRDSSEAKPLRTACLAWPAPSRSALNPDLNPYIGRITWSPHSFSSGLLRKGRQVIGQPSVVVLLMWQLPNKTWTEKGKHLLSIFHVTSEASHSHQVFVTYPWKWLGTVL